jgi:hypothetical protein
MITLWLFSIALTIYLTRKFFYRKHGVALGLLYMFDSMANKAQNELTRKEVIEINLKERGESV